MLRSSLHFYLLEIRVILGYFSIDVLKLMINGLDGLEIGFLGVDCSTAVLVVDAGDLLEYGVGVF